MEQGQKGRGKRNTCRVWAGAGDGQGEVRGPVSRCFMSLDTQILVWHTRTEKPVLVNEGKKGFTDPTVEI